MRMGWLVLLLILALISQVTIEARKQKQIVDRSCGSNSIPTAQRSGNYKLVVPSSLMMFFLKDKSIIDTTDEHSRKPVVLCQTVADRRRDLLLADTHLISLSDSVAGKQYEARLGVGIGLRAKSTAHAFFGLCDHCVDVGTDRPLGRGMMLQNG
jgi:hypothetical protein